MKRLLLALIMLLTPIACWGQQAEAARTYRVCATGRVIDTNLILSVQSAPYVDLWMIAETGVSSYNARIDKSDDFGSTWGVVSTTWSGSGPSVEHIGTASASSTFTSNVTVLVGGCLDITILAYKTPYSGFTAQYSASYLGFSGTSVGTGLTVNGSNSIDLRGAKSLHVRGFCNGAIWSLAWLEYDATRVSLAINSASVTAIPSAASTNFFATIVGASVSVSTGTVAANAYSPVGAAKVVPAITNAGAAPCTATMDIVVQY